MVVHTREEQEANIERMTAIYEQVVATSMGVEPLAHRIRGIESGYEYRICPWQRALLFSIMGTGTNRWEKQNGIMRNKGAVSNRTLLEDARHWRVCIS